MDFNSNYIIPRGSRKNLSKPAGELLVGTIDENIKKAPYWFKEHYMGPGKDYEVICVGDVVSEAFINDPELSSHLKMGVVDGKTKRKTYSIKPGKILPNIISIKNAAGIISGEASKKLMELLKSDKKYFVKVDGEEDALVIPIVIFSKENTFIVYGQPPITDSGTEIPAGMVIITANIQIKKRFRELIKLFEVRKKD